MSFKNRAATTVAAGAASLALALGTTPLAGAQDASNATNASGTGTISVPSDSTLDMRVAVVDGKPNVMVSNSSNVPSATQPESNNSALSESGSNESDKPATETPDDKTEPTDDEKVTTEDLGARNALDWIFDYIKNKKDGEKFGEFIDRVKSDVEKGKPVEKGNDSTGSSVLDTATGDIRSNLSDLLSKLGITPKGVDGTESRADAKNKTNLEELTKLIDDIKVKLDEIPDFVKSNGKNGLTANTEGVKPGTYSINGTVTDADGNEKKFKFDIKVEDNGKADGNSEGTGSTEGNKTDESDKPDADGAKSEASENQFYDDAEIRPGSSLTVKPKSDVEGLDGYVFMNAMNDEKWIDVKEDGTVDIEMSDGASEGERDVYVAYAKRSDMSKINNGDKSAIKLDKFKLNVSKDAKETEKSTDKRTDKENDASANQSGENTEAMNKSLNDATNKLNEGSKSGSDGNNTSDKRSDGFYDDVEVAVGDSVTASPNDAQDRVFAAVLLTDENDDPVAEADNFPIDPTTEEISIDDKGEITIAPSGELLKAGEYKASVITSKPENADKFASLVENQDLEGIISEGEVHEFGVSVTGEASDNDNGGGAGADAAAAQNGAGEQPADQPQAQYDPQSEGSLAQTGVSLYAQLGLAAAALVLAGIAAVFMRRRGFTQ